MSKLRKYPTYRHALHTQSVLTITSNVVYGKATGNTPDGRRQRRAVRAGRKSDARPRQPRHSRRPRPRSPRFRTATLQTASRSPTSLVPEGLGRIAEDRITNLTAILDAFFSTTGYHMNVNVLNREMLHRCDGSSGEVPEPDDPRVGLRGELRAAHARAADGRDQSDLPWSGAQCLNGDDQVRRSESRSRRGARASSRRISAQARSRDRCADGARAPATWDFSTRFTTGSTVDGPGVRVVAWTSGLHVALLSTVTTPTPGR